MSSPGRQPRSVYWRRRALVLLGLFAVAVAIVLIVVRPTTPTPSAAAPPPPTLAAETIPPAAAEPTPTGPPPCAPGQVQVTPVTDAESYAGGVAPQLSWTLLNLGTEPCVLDVGTAHQVYTVTSGSDTVWKSTDCQTAFTDTPYTLPAGADAVPVVSTPIAWERERSSPNTCADVDRPKVPAGGSSYHLAVSVGGVTSTQSAQFLLH